MGGPALTTVGRADVQGLTAFGYGKLTEACYLLARVKDRSMARRWCSNAPVSTAEELPNAPDTAMQIAFTAQGLLNLGADGGLVAQFSSEFCSGMAEDPSRSRRLGDTGPSDPDSWAWGSGGNVPDLVVCLFAKQNLEDWRRRVEGDHWNQAFDTLLCLPTSNMHGREPFGFRDGISQPEIDWKRERDSSGDQTSYTNLVAPGEFVLGYPNEYGKYTDRPLLDRAADQANLLPSAEDAPGKKDLGRNGSYLVIRQLEQDVRNFWQYLEGAARTCGVDREWLAARLVGRTIEGDPLIPGSSGDPQNGFIYDADANGLRCPFGAHIRRSNPRTADLPGKPNRLTAMLLSLGIPRAEYGQDLIASTRFHRLLRRGREYGRELTPELALQPASADEQRCGLNFACINGNIARQFEFLQNAWLMNRKFNGLADENDPLLGSGSFSIPREGSLRRILVDMPQFVRVRGGAYFFMPGIRALRYLTRKDD